MLYETISGLCHIASQYAMLALQALIMRCRMHLSFGQIPDSLHRELVRRLAIQTLKNEMPESLASEAAARGTRTVRELSREKHLSDAKLLRKYM